MSRQQPTNGAYGLGFSTVVSKTANYLIAASDVGTVFKFNGSGLTATLPATAPSMVWGICIINVNASALTVDPNGLTLNGNSSSITIPQYGGIIIWTDGTNYVAPEGVVVSATPSGAAGGDLSGTYPNPTVAQVNGAAVPASAGVLGSNSSRQLVDDTANVQNSVYDYQATDTGSANAYAVALSPAVASYVAGLFLKFKAANTNTATSTLAVNGLATKTIKKLNGTTNLVAGDITAGQVVCLIYDGTNFQLVSEMGTAESTANKDAANGYAGLDSNTMLKTTEMQTAVVAVAASSYNVLNANRAKTHTFSDVSPVSDIAVSLPQAGASSQFIAGWYAYFQSLSAANVVTITPTTSTINSGTGATTALKLGPGQCCMIVSDGTNYVALFLSLPGNATDAQVLTWVTADKRWEPKSISALGGANASQLRGNNISSATPTDEQVLQWSATDNQYDLVYADGIYHGDRTWDADSSCIKLMDDFFGGSNGSTNTGLFGNLGWTVTGGTYTPLYWGGAPPHLGLLVMPANGLTTQQTQGIIGMRATTNSQVGDVPLLEYPGWKMEWVWRWGYSTADLATVSAAQFSASSKLATYIGMACAGGFQNNAMSRPHAFVGLRFDTDAGAQQTNASGTMTGLALQIADTTMKFECIANPVNRNGNRNNAQGIIIYQKITANAGSVANNGTVTANFTHAITPSSTIVVLVATGGTTAPQVTDSATNATTFTNRASQNDAGSAFSVYIFSGTTSAVAVTTDTDTITVKNVSGSTQSMAFWAYEIVSTQGGTITFDSSAGSNGTGTAATTGNITLAGQDELVFEVTGVGTTSEAVSNAAASGWLLDTTVTGLTTGLFSAGSSLAQTTLEGTKAGSSTLAASKPWALLAGAFKTSISSFFDTGVLPIVGKWYRLELKCVVAGQVQLTLFSNNVQIAQHTFTVPQYTNGNLVSNAIVSCQGSATQGTVTTRGEPGGGMANIAHGHPFSGGSLVTVAGITGANPSTLNGSHVIASGIQSSVADNFSFYVSSGTTFGASAPQTITATGYAAYSPVAFMGNIAISSGFTQDFTMELDLFKFVWSSSLANSPLAYNVNYSRYHATPSDQGI